MGLEHQIYPLTCGIQTYNWGKVCIPALDFGPAIFYILGWFLQPRGQSSENLGAVGGSRLQPFIRGAVGGNSPQDTLPPSVWDSPA